MSARLTAILLVTASLLLHQGCAVNPATGGANMVVSSRAGEIEQGREMHEEMMGKGAAYDDPELQDYVNRIGQRLATHSDMPDLEWTFTVIDAPDLNAFALPGGFIYVNRGLLAYLDSEAQLAGVIGHEIAHVTARHHARRKSAGVTSKVLATTAYIFTGSRDVYAAS
ncbi:MAG: M48 family metalloprotease, partial [Chromatocurvus sp.]